MNSFLRLPKIKLLFIFFLVVCGYDALAQPSIESFAHNECDNRATFKFYYNYQRRNHAGISHCSQPIDDYHDGYVKISVGGTEHNIVQIKRGQHYGTGWVRLKGTGRSDSWVSFKKLVNWVSVSDGGRTQRNPGDCTAGLGRTEYFNYASIGVDIPEQHSGNGQQIFFKITGSWDGDNRNNVNSSSSSIRMLNIQQPSGLIVSEECGYVNLKWSRPSFACTNDADFVIFRDGKQIKVIDYDGNLEFNDSGTDLPGSRLPYKKGGYEYEVFLRFNSNQPDFSDPSKAEASPLREFDNPDYFESFDLVVTDECNQRLRLDWEVAEDVNVDRFVIERSTSKNFESDETDYFEVSNKFVLSYNDDNVPLDRRYFYRIIGYDECGSNGGNGIALRSEMVIDTIFDGPPVYPTITDIVASNDGNKTATIHWSHDGLKTESFRILRNGQEIGVIDDPSARFFVDTNPINCATYEYQVEAIGKCFPNEPGRSQIVDQIISFNEDLNSFDFFSVSKNFFNDKISLRWQLAQQALDNNVQVIAVFRKREGSSDTPEEVARFEAQSSEWNDFDAEAGVLYRYGVMAIACEGYQPSLNEINLMITDVGMRSEYGIINGKVTYEGGNAVEGVRVIAAPSSGESRGVSLYMEKNQLNIPLEKNGTSWFPQNSWTTSFWLQLTAPQSSNEIFKVTNGTDSVYVSANMKGQQEFYDISYIEKRETVGEVDELIGYKNSSGQIISLKDGSILAQESGSELTELEKQEIYGLVKNDTLYDFRTKLPLLFKKADSWHELVLKNEKLATPDSIIGYLQGDTIYESFDSDFVIAFIENDQLRMAQHYNTSYVLGDRYGYIKNNQFFLANEEDPKGNVIDDIIYSLDDEAIHMVNGNNVFYVYRDELNDKLVRGKRFARKIPNTTDPEISFDLILYEKAITEEIRKGAVLGIVASDKSKVFENDDQGLINYLIDDQGVVRTAVYLDTSLYVPVDEVSFTEANGILLNTANEITFLFNNSKDTLFTIESRILDIESDGFIKDRNSGDYNYFLGSVIDGEQQVFKAINNEISIIENDTTNTYLKSAYNLHVNLISGQQFSITTEDLYVNEFNNVLLSYDETNLILYLNGKTVDTINFTGLNSLFQTNNQEIVFGEFNGHLDEVLIWSEAKTETEINQDYNRYLTGGEDHLAGYWRLDEGIGQGIYDVSYQIDNTGKKIFYENHAGISFADAWSNVVPDSEELSFTAYTDNEGNYSIQSIIYAGAGNNFRVVPIFGSHKFNPGNEVLFLGKSQQIHNRVDFVDVSSFTVTGTVKYAPTILGFDSNEDPDAPNCYVENVDILVDGKVVLSDGKQVKTDKNGRFVIQVPIGKHNISVLRQNHEFVSDVWPPQGDFDFQQDQFDLVFLDKTKRKIIGKVVGGVTEGEKESGTMLPINNIGIAKIKLKSIGKTCFETIIETDSLTGEYYAELPPFRYNVVDISIPSQSTNFNRSLRKLATASINLDRDTLSLKNVPCLNRDLCQVTSRDYHFKRDFTYKNTPQIIVESQDVSFPDILGDQEWDFETDEVDPVDLTDKPLPFEVFSSGEKYSWNIALLEQYRNYDAAPDVHVYNDTIRAGEILIKNDIADESVILDLAAGKVVYTFAAGESSILMDRSNPESSFTKTVQISGSDVNWEPNGEVFRGYIFGTVQDKTQQSFYTVSESGQEYQLIDFVLRDPPGSQSYARLDEKTKVTKVRSSKIKNGIEQQSNLRGGVMIAVETVAGPISISNQIFKNTIGIASSTNQYRSAEQVAVISFETDNSVQTSADNKNTGAGSDIFVGNAINIFYSPSHNVELIPVTSCGQDGIECYPLSFDIGGVSYSVGRARSVSFGLEEIPTLFQYTQRQIEQLIFEMEKDLESVVEVGERSRIKNQIRIWKSAIAQNEYEKLIAKHELDNNSDNTTSENLSFAYGSNVRRSYQLGVTNEFQNAQEFNWYVGGTINLEMLFGPVYLKFDLDLGYANYVSTSDKTSVSNSKALTIQMSDKDPGDRYSVDVILQTPEFQNIDGRQELTDLYDEFSTQGQQGLFPTNDGISDVDNEFLYNPDQVSFYNPIYITRGGRTSCPYEPQENARYLEYLKETQLSDLKEKQIISDFTFDADSKTADITYLPPSDGLGVNDKIVLNYGTFKRDQPGLQIEPRIKRNVPWDQRAQFDIILENKNVEDTIRTYTLYVDQRTTGAGPTMRLDGERFIKGTPIPLYGGEALRKTFTMRPIRDVYDYENIVIYLAAGCQFDFGQDLDFQEDIFDRDTISAYFDPVCPMATEVAPTQGWSINNNTGSKLNLEIQEQLFYFENHSKIILQYKAAYQTDEDWVDIAIWSKDPAEVEALKNSGENAFDFDTENNYIVYDWETADYLTPDGEYMVRWKYFCQNGLQSQSSPITGRIDRTSPHAFGRPQPADGILSPNDEIILTLNEPIEEGLVDRDLIKVRGKINGTQLLHPVSIRFAGNEQVEIPNIHWNQEAITVEMWVRKDGNPLNDEILFHHSEAGKSAITFTLQQDGRLQLKLNNSVLITDDPVSLTEWSHIAFSFDPSTRKAAIYKNATIEAFDELFIGTHIASGSIEVGEDYYGNLHELRLWKRYMTATDIAPNFYKDLTGREIGLVGYWSLSEGKGTLANDKVQGRNAILSANWWMEPASMSYEFKGDNPISLPSLAFEATEDFTVEFWIKPTLSSSKQTIVSNGGPAGIDWNIYLSTTNQLVLDHNQNHYMLIDSTLEVNKWHHIAIVVNRIGKTTTYLNGNVNSALPNSLFSGFGGPGVFLGANFTADAIGNLTASDHFTGLMDEFRIWRMAKRAEQIKRTSWYKLNGEELGLVSYLPFERYNDFLRITEGSLAIYNEDNDNFSGTSDAEAYSNENPEIILKPTETPVNFDYSVSGNQILISLDEDNPAVVENCILDISIRNLIDKNGNVMESPVTWSAFVDRNQIVWDQRTIKLEKEPGEKLSFTANVVNQGGENTSFRIQGLPLWLTASPSSGLVGPDSRQEIIFTVNPGLNIGDYQEPIHLVTDFGFNESLLLDMQVRADLPKDWSFNPADYQYTMNLIGQAKIDNIYSRDPEDIIGAFVNDTLRGLASLEYQDVYDNYQVFLSVYSNELSGEELDFRIWDASEGKVLNNIKADGETVSFVENAIIGSPANPVTFEAKNSVLRQIDIPRGWKWISFNLNSDDLSRTRNLFKNQENEDGDRILSADEVDVYDGVNDLWLGKIAGDNLPPGVGGYDVHQSYRVYADKETQLTISGDPLELSTQAINLYSPVSSVNATEWNWISFLGQDNMEVNEALASLNPAAGDLIKSQYAFAIYDPVLKWVGNLRFLQPGEGYLIKISTDQQLIYPASGLITGARMQNELQESILLELNPHKFKDNMSMVVQVVGLPIGTKDVLLKSYYDNEVRGVSKSVIDEQGRLLFFLTNYGNASSEKLRFSLQFEGETTQFDLELPFEANSTQGTFSNPVILNTGDAEKQDLFGYSYPNPFSDEVNINFVLGELGRANVKVFAMDGKLILDRDFSGNTNESVRFLWDGKSDAGSVIASGNYILQIDNYDVAHQELLVKE